MILILSIEKYRFLRNILSAKHRCVVSTPQFEVSYTCRSVVLPQTLNIKSFMRYGITHTIFFKEQFCYSCQLSSLSFSYSTRARARRDAQKCTGIAFLPQKCDRVLYEPFYFYFKERLLYLPPKSGSPTPTVHDQIRRRWLYLPLNSRSPTPVGV